MKGGIGKQMFLFDESTEVKLKLQLFYKEQGVRRSAVIDATIKYKDGCLTLYAEEVLTSRNLDKGLGIFFMKDFGKSDYKVKEANVGGQAIELKIGEKLLFNNSYLEKGKRVFSMELKHIMYSYEWTGHPTCYRLTKVSSSLVSPYLTGFTLSGNTVVGTQPTEYSGKCFNGKISLSRDEHYVYLETEDNISDILSVLSFFFCSPVEYDMVYSIDQNGRSVIEVCTPSYKVLAEKRNNILGYLFSKDTCLDYLTDFFEITKCCSGKLPITNALKQYIDHYVRVEYLDSISKLLLYHTIIEKMAGVGKDNDTYNIIHKFLKERHIDVEKINDGIASKGIKNEESQTIDNFVQLRNFFVHHLGSKKAVEFLEESEMLFNLKAAITIILLDDLGIQDVRYDKQFHALSIYDESVKECDTFTELFNEARELASDTGKDDVIKQ